jgi:outer membrane receptor protein involved in Fe transport
VFYIDWDNQAFFETTSVPGKLGAFLSVPTNVAYNAGNSRVYGLELETSLAITDHLLATFAYGFTDSEFKEGYSCDYASATGNGLYFNPSIPRPNKYDCLTDRDEQLANSNLKGNTIPNSPRHNFVTSLSYIDQITSELGWFTRTDYSYEDGRFTEANNFAEIGKRQIWNARGGLETDGWTATLFVNNMLDEQTPSAIIAFPRFGQTTVGNRNVPLQGYAMTPIPGRIWGGEIVVRFGARR